jgi:hypothetical protein
MTKLQARDRAKLVVFAYESGLVAAVNRPPQEAISLRLLP